MRLMPEDCGGQVTELLQNWKQGDEDALRDLLPLVYKELRRLAHYNRSVPTTHCRARLWFTKPTCG